MRTFIIAVGGDYLMHRDEKGEYDENSFIAVYDAAIDVELDDVIKVSKTDEIVLFEVTNGSKPFTEWEYKTKIIS